MGTITTTADLSGGGGFGAHRFAQPLRVRPRRLRHVGNVDEWVPIGRDHSGTSSGCRGEGLPNWTALYGSDYRCIGGDGR